MRVITFYSYKGGVGRTLAMLNVAADLVRRGNRVLLVDFDLEAPGLDAVKSLQFERSRGLVELIGDYLADRTVPEVAGYVVPARFQSSRARDNSTGIRTLSYDIDLQIPVDLSAEPLLVLPAGDRQNEANYLANLSRIDFGKLYREQHGYLFFDDLRAQFGAALCRDYVLIDSRTGHTDIGKVGTLQLADHVVALMVPNQQNLVGIESEVAAIRKAQPRCGIDVVLSRMPEGDDFEGILGEFGRTVRRKTRVMRPLMVRASTNLSLLEDEVYCAFDRYRRSALTHDYRQITKSILVRNTADRRACLYALDGGGVRVRNVVGKELVDEWLESARAAHWSDETVLEALAQAVHKAGKSEFAARVDARIKDLTETGAAARSALDAIRLESTDAVAAAVAAKRALASRNELGRALSAECFAVLCRTSPNDADLLTEKLGEKGCRSLGNAESLDEHGDSLLQTVAGARVIRAVLRAELRLGRQESDSEFLIPFDANGDGALTEVRPSRKALDWYILACAAMNDMPAWAAAQAERRKLAEAINRTAEFNSSILKEGPEALAPYGSFPHFAWWMLAHARGKTTRAQGYDSASRLTVNGIDPDGEPDFGTADAELTDWERAGVWDDAPIEQRGFAAIAHLLFGNLKPAKMLIQEIDVAVRSREIRETDLVANGWRMLYRPIRELRQDLAELIRLRTEEMRSSDPQVQQRSRLVVPFGRRRS
ncbi:MAG: hypothetical protein RIR10_936 [Planctomycetota bacterium]